ncbi:MAG TPA: choice-of-anchor L domain-containing protein [Chitinophagaceae bacterium]|nr:choice-of-anchor L domain-containing protein [Chitinophagaceae bacterium]
MMMIPMMGWAQGASTSNMKLFPFKNDSMYTWPPTPLPNNSIYNDIDEMVPQLIGEGISVYSNEEISMFGGSPGKYQTYINNAPYYTVFYFCKFAFEGSSDIGIDTGWVLSTGPTWPYISYMGEAVPGRQGMSGIAWPAVYNSSALNRDPNAWGSVAQPGFPRLNHAATIPLQDPDLSSLVKDSIYQANVLEFDFIPEGDSIGLDYICLRRIS